MNIIKKNYLKTMLFAAAVLGAIILQIIFWANYGTQDMSSFINLAQVLAHYGLRGGYAHYNLFYPPLSSVFVYPATFFYNYIVNANPLQAAMPIKLIIFIFYYLSFVIIFVYYKKYKKNNWIDSLKSSGYFFINIALFESAIVLSYLDIFIAPFLLLSFFFIDQKKYFWSGAFLAIAFMTKLLPVLLIPAFIIYFCGRDENGKIKIDFKNMQLYILGVLTVTVPLICYFGFIEFAKVLFVSAGLGRALSHSYNFIRIFSELGGNNALTPLFYYGGRVVFLVVSAVLLVKLYLAPKNISSLLYTCIGILFTYFMFFTGVSENHIFPSLILCIIAVIYNRDHFNVLACRAFTGLVFLNLFIPYGIGYSFSKHAYLSPGILLNMNSLQLRVVYIIVSILSVAYYFYFMSVISKMINSHE